MKKPSTLASAEGRGSVGIGPISEIGRMRMPATQPDTSRLILGRVGSMFRDGTIVFNPSYDASPFRSVDS